MRKNIWSRNGSVEITFTELGFGTVPLGNLYRSISDVDGERMLEAVWASGVRYFDTAPLYGLTLAETRLGRFLAGKRRDQFVLSTKAGRLMRPCPPAERTGIGQWSDVPAMQQVYDYSYDGILQCFEESLERMGTDRVDILFVHDLCVFTHGSKLVSDQRTAEFMAGGYGAMVRLRDEGAVGAIGAGVNEWEVCQELAEMGDFDLFLLAGRYTLLEQGSLDSFLPLCERRGIGVVIGGPYNSGILASGPRAGACYNYVPAPEHILERVRRIEAVCESHSTCLRTAALKFPMFHPAVVSVIPGGQTAEEAKSNRQILDTPVPAQLWQDLKSNCLLRDDAPVPG